MSWKTKSLVIAKKILSNQNTSIIALLILSLAVGLLTLKDYGESWDEYNIYKYSNYAINAYQYLFHPQDLPNFPGDLNNYGTAYFIIANILSQLFVAIIPSWSMIVAWHFIYFLTFLAAVLITYLFARRWASEWAAFGAALLLLTQPLLWGHAFMNPKDTPFMTFFLASIYLGFCMVDAPDRSPRQMGLMLLAGIILGLTTSMRVIGPLAGLFVLVYAIIRKRQKAIYPTIIYLLITAFTTYLTWPFLWKAPISNFFVSLRVMSQFPFSKKVLFWGQRYDADQLPRSFFPTIFSLQLTEPLLFLFAAGVLGMAINIRRKEKFEPLLLFLGWFLIPAVIIYLSNSTLYDNARQLYFLLPPVFFAAGLALDFIFEHLSSKPIRIGLLLIAVLPGIYPAVRLHPYEYIYYNSLVRGTGGAYRQFEMDYWATSFEAATNYIDQVAPQGARIMVFGPEWVVQQYARPDLQVFNRYDTSAPQGGYDYAVILTRQNLDERICQKAELVYSVGRRGAIFTVVKKLSPEGQCN